MRCWSSSRSRLPVDIEAAFVAAREAQAEWSQWPLRKRLAVFKRAHTLLVDNAHTTTDLIQAESGKNRRMAMEETCDPPMVISHYLKRAPKLLAPTRRGGPVPVVSSSTEIRQPKGVVGVIAPWNFPFATGISDAVTALMAGNGIVLKPDNKTALSPLYGVSLLEQAGLPKGLFQVVCGEGPDVGPTLIDNANYVMFTGSTATGRVIGERAGRNLIGCCLELGGKNPMIVLDDAVVDDVVAGALFGVFGNTGQICMHIERIYLPDSLYDEFRSKFVAAAEGLRLGASYDFGPELGSLISVDHRDRVASHVEDAVAKGATVVTGGRARPDLGPAFFEPTVLEGVTKEMLAGSCETFGPVVALHRYATVDEAVALANDTDYGLNASVWGTDLDRAAAVGRRIESGNVNINDALAAAYASKGTPSGGVKQSGIGARHGDQGLLKYTDVQNLAVLKKPVLGPKPGQDYAEYAKQMLTGLKVMRRTTASAEAGRSSRRAGASVAVPQPPASGDLKAALRQPHPEAVDHLDPRLVGGRRGAEGDEQRRVVLDGRVREGHPRRLRLVRRQCVDVAAGHRLAGPRVEVRRPAGDRGVDAPLGEERQPVGEEPGPDDQHALVAEWSEPLPERHQPDRVLGGQRQLQHRDVGLGVHDPQRHPRPMVEPAAGVLVDRLARGHHRRDPGGQLGGVRRLVGHPVVLRVETAEVVDQRCAAGAQADRSRLPVGADDEDRTRARQVGGPGGELPDQTGSSSSGGAPCPM